MSVTNDPGGDTSTSVQQSSLGVQLQNNVPVQVVNEGVGANQFLITGSQLPWGLAIINSQPSYGNETIIDSSYIGQTATGGTRRRVRFSASPARNPATWRTSRAAPTAWAAPTPWSSATER